MHIRLSGSSLQMSFETPRASGDIVFLLVHPSTARARPHMRCPGNPNPVDTEEADLRAWPAFGLDVDSPGATRICVLLVRGTLTFRSFRRLPSQVETGRTCDVYNGQLVHPCRVNLFEKPCPRLWTTQSLCPVHRITSTIIML